MIMQEYKYFFFPSLASKKHIDKLWRKADEMMIQKQIDELKKELKIVKKKNKKEDRKKVVL